MTHPKATKVLQDQGLRFSHLSSETPTPGDKGTAEDNLRFLVGFFQRFPSLRRNGLWLSGESYAGHYVPQVLTCVNMMSVTIKGR